MGTYGVVRREFTRPTNLDELRFEGDELIDVLEQLVLLQIGLQQ